MSICVFYPDSEPVPFRYAVPTRWSGEIPPPYDSSLLPQDYLEFAIEDMLGARPQNLVNAFGNIKRSMHFLIDCILYQYGVFTHHRTVNFPAKLRLLDGIGILPITLVRNLNIERNLLEHEYAIPSRKRVEEALDVAKLLLMATERLVERIPTELVVGWRNPKRHFVLRLDPIRGEITLHNFTAKGKYARHNGISHFSGGLRSITGGYLPGIGVVEKPCRTIPINRARSTTWKPIIAELVNLQRRTSRRETVVNRGSGEVVIPITIPLPELPSKSWSELIDELLLKKTGDDENKKAN